MRPWLSYSHRLTPIHTHHTHRHTHMTDIETLYTHLSHTYRHAQTQTHIQRHGTHRDTQRHTPQADTTLGYIFNHSFPACVYLGRRAFGVRSNQSHAAAPQHNFQIWLTLANLGTFYHPSKLSHPISRNPTIHGSICPPPITSLYFFVSYQCKHTM